ncbi:hypothetical protein [Paucisalibacillus sp. EB02]|uniref:hypothetical protein n=1 Tax=Paucisalibacillus sp. EB02 TaxID=1347087 RepID=UPI0004BC1D9B|nr:hypothetical protein [Paucisalibacillus sp. EB02]
MEQGFVDWIKLSHLQSLGIPKEVFFTIVIFLGIVGCYFMIRPVTFILMSIKSERLLNYLLSGLSFIVIFFIVVLLIGEIELLTYQLFKVTLQALALFGLLLCVVHLIKTVFLMRKKA